MSRSDFNFADEFKGQPGPVASSTRPALYSGGPAGRGRGDGSTFDPLIGRKVWTRWPEDNNFYEAVITDFNSAEVCLSTRKI